MRHVRQEGAITSHA